MMRTDAAEPMTLRAWLIVDVALVLSAGVLLMLAATPLGRWLGLPEPLLFWVGVVLTGYVGVLLVAARRDAALGWTRLVLAANLGWVLLSAAVLLTGVLTPSGLGWVVIPGQALVVLAMTLVEWRALVRMTALGAGAGSGVA